MKQLCALGQASIYFLEVVAYLPCVSATSNIKAATGKGPLIVQAGYIHLPQEEAIIVISYQVLTACKDTLTAKGVGRNSIMANVSIYSNSA